MHVAALVHVSAVRAHIPARVPVPQTAPTHPCIPLLMFMHLGTAHAAAPFSASPEKTTPLNPIETNVLAKAKSGIQRHD